MELPDVSNLAELRSLDRALLHVFVAGPGEGEGIAIAFPGHGWMLVDGCRTINRGPDRFPIECICKRFRASEEDVVELMILTHSHADHTHGFAELIEEFRPKRVGLVGTSDPLRTLSEEAVELARLRRESSTAASLNASRVLQVLRGIDAWASAGHDVVPLNDGVNAFERGALTVGVRAPDGPLYEQLKSQYGLEAVLGPKANWFSLALEVAYDRCRIVLGGDLLRTQGHQRVPTGWDLVMSRHVELVYHHGLKIPHHGSREAIHNDIMGPVGVPRAWCLTPFNSSSLPKTDDEDGLDIILSSQTPVMLTSLSVSRKLQVALTEGRVSRPTLSAATEAIKRGELFKAEDTVWRTGTAHDPLDPVWCVAFDRAGTIKGRWRGAAAVEVHRESK